MDNFTPNIVKIFGEGFEDIQWDGDLSPAVSCGCILEETLDKAKELSVPYEKWWKSYKTLLEEVIDANLIKYTNDGGKTTIQKIVGGWSHRDEQPVANGIVAIGGTQQNFQSDMEKFWRLEARAFSYGEEEALIYPEFLARSSQLLFSKLTDKPNER